MLFVDLLLIGAFLIYSHYRKKWDKENREEFLKELGGMKETMQEMQKEFQNLQKQVEALTKELQQQRGEFQKFQQELINILQEFKQQVAILGEERMLSNEVVVDRKTSQDLDEEFNKSLKGKNETNPAPGDGGEALIEDIPPQRYRGRSGSFYGLGDKKQQELQENKKVIPINLKKRDSLTKTKNAPRKKRM
ncbi:hypothetical protein [Abyssalbus ytuae]|uniref:Uncharacterized protein n=1 Tax=Abyssalbus ytuae TaxID=2926907 RepID=A0A9E6ZMR3_9FLAO|nr:hypothetical protein [Abyssalbus ytuae]UOB17115.1 hypothetical protein MQE35_15410 [Abyssalbus ytuae]